MKIKVVYPFLQHKVRGLFIFCQHYMVFSLEYMNMNIPHSEYKPTGIWIYIYMHNAMLRVLGPYSPTSFNLLPNGKILNQSKLKAFADDRLKMAQVAKLILDKIENIVGKEENAGYQHFLLFLQCFQKASSMRVVKRRDCLVKR